MREWFENKTVSLVGNATSLLSKRNGHRIDSKEVVVRMNKGITASFLPINAVSMGNKTDVWMFNLYNDNIKRVELKFPHNNFKKMQMNETGDKEGYDSFYTREFYEEIKHIVFPKKISTGLRAIDYILKSNPKELHIFGFDWKATPTFYAPRSSDGMHNFRKEKLYVEQLIEASKDRIFLYK